MINECIDPNWNHIWDKIRLDPLHPDFYSLSKEELKNNIMASLTYGAILLKTFITFIQVKNNKDGISLEMSEIYFRALQMYNGEPGERKVLYAKHVFMYLKNIYPKPLSFPFLEDSF